MHRTGKSKRRPESVCSFLNSTEAVATEKASAFVDVSHVRSHDLTICQNILLQLSRRLVIAASAGLSAGNCLTPECHLLIDFTWAFHTLLSDPWPQAAFKKLPWQMHGLLSFWPTLLTSLLFVSTLFYFMLSLTLTQASGKMLYIMFV